MKITYDKEANAAYIYLKDIGIGEVKKTYSCNPNDVDGEINLDFDDSGHLIGIEVLDANKKLSNVVLDSATSIDI